jgi:SH3 domain-containing YSC84-like protein 1
MHKLVSTALVILGLCSVAVAADDAKKMSKLDDRINAAHAVLHELMDTPDKGIPLDIAAKAKCVAVIPGLIKGAFLVGAEYGQGLATCRTPHGWSAPVFIQLAGGSFGFQAGGQATDLVLVGTNQKSMDNLLKDKVKLGGDVAAAAGPVGRDSQADTTELANAAFLTYSRSRGLFAGVDLTGAEIHQNTSDTDTFYGKDIPYKTILSGAVPTPTAAHHFIVTVSELVRMGRQRQAAKAK